jgi:hypothetical protein
MSGNSELDLQSLIADWQASASQTPPTAADQIRDYVERRSRLLSVWFTVDMVIGTVFLAFLTHRALTHPDPVEKLAMGLLAAITAATMAFGWWNWRGARHASARDTSTFVALSAERSRRLARSIRASWVVLAAQVAVFTPWVYHRLYGDGQRPALAPEIFGWGFLALMVVLAMVFIRSLTSWAHRDAATFEQIRAELEEE